MRPLVFLISELKLLEMLYLDVQLICMHSPNNFRFNYLNEATWASSNHSPPKGKGKKKKGK